MAYMNVLGVPDEPPKIKEQFSWDEFLGGLAKGALSGYKAGIDLQELSNAEQTKRLAAMRSNPTPYLDEYDYRKSASEPVSLGPATPTTEVPSDQIPGRDFGVTGDIPDLGSVGIPERTTPREMGRVNLMDAKEARDRQLARSRSAMDPELKKRMEKIKQSDLDILHAEDLRQQTEIEADALKDVMIEYGRNISIAKRLVNEREDAEKMLDVARKSGVPSQIDKAVSDARKASDAVEAVRQKILQHEAIFEELNIPESEYNRLGEAQSRSGVARDLLRKYKGTTRTRKPGTK